MYFHAERFTDVLDGGMITLAIFTLNFVHPGRFLGSVDTRRKK